MPAVPNSYINVLPWSYAPNQGSNRDSKSNEIDLGLIRWQKFEHVNSMWYLLAISDSTSTGQLLKSREQYRHDVETLWWFMSCVIWCIPTTPRTSGHLYRGLTLHIKSTGIGWSRRGKDCWSTSQDLHRSPERPKRLEASSFVWVMPRGHIQSFDLLKAL